MGKRRRGADTPGQFLIEWDGTSAPESSAQAASPLKPQAEASPLVQHLKWDFRETFPQPLPEAVYTGVLDETDLEPENIRTLHDEHAGEALAALQCLDIVLDARRLGVDPKTRRPPRTQDDREALQDFLNHEVDRFQRWWRILMETYEQAFGAEAADAFGKAIQARHAGIEVVADQEPAAPPLEPVIPPSQPIAAESGKPVSQLPDESKRSRGWVSTCLPVPKPLPAAVAAGHFGHDEKGVPVRPGPDEVRAITENHAEKLIALVDAAKHSAPPGQQHAAAGYEAGLNAYAEDFGQDAARQLEAYVQRQASLGKAGQRVARRER